MPALKLPQPKQDRPLDPQALEARVMAGFTGPIQRVRISLVYRLGILLVTAVMVVLPLIYVGLIAVVAYGVYWHMVNNIGILGTVRGRGAIFTFLIYVAPLVVGAILILFMIKPLFAAPARRGRTRSLTRDSDPLLFKFVARICETVRAPTPSRIDIDHQINASASFRRGLLSFLGSDLVLTIGMPLAGGLSLQQFAGVLAHEFGHFSQGAGMRLTYIIRAISHWFLRVVYQRDEWDEWLASSTDGVDLRIAWILYLAQACVWLTRRILWVLMYVGHVVAGFMLRQMEFDADRYEARLAGSDTFAATVRQLHLLNLAQERAQSDFGFYFREGRLTDNLPKLVLANVRQMPAEAQSFISKVIAESQTGLFDTHPGDKDRIVSAEAERAPGVFRSDLPATVLFRNFDAAARNVTWDFYCDVFETPVPQSSLVPVEELLKKTDEEQVVAEARERFFQGTFQFLRPLRLASATLPRSPDVSIEQDRLHAARQAMSAHAEEYRSAVARYDALEAKALEALATAAVYRADVRPRKPVGSSHGSMNEAAQAHSRARDQMGRMDRELEPYESAAAQRLLSALTILMDRRSGQRIEQGELMQEQAQKLLPIVGLVSAHLPGVIELRSSQAVLSALLGHLEGNESHQSLIGEIIDAMKRCQQQLADLRQMFTHEPYPFDHAKGEMTIARYLLEMPPPSDDLGAIASGTEQLLSNLALLYNRAVGRLSWIAERVEEDLALTPLRMPGEHKSATSAPSAMPGVSA
jgi:Zn-dependent protease with chaperone function